jgi:hypothetical protein
LAAHRPLPTCSPEIPAPQQIDARNFPFEHEATAPIDETQFRELSPNSYLALAIADIFIGIRHRAKFNVFRQQISSR